MRNFNDHHHREVKNSRQQAVHVVVVLKEGERCAWRMKALSRAAGVGQDRFSGGRRRQGTEKPVRGAAALHAVHAGIESPDDDDIERR